MRFLKNTNTWDKALNGFLSEKYKAKINALLDQKDITPPKVKVFKALELLPCHKVKVVILGQDPYPEEGLATGLAFAVEPDNTPLPQSLKNIFICVNRNHPDSVPTSCLNPTLQSWAKQGVLLLNTSLTTKINKSAAHLEIWEPFITAVIQSIVNRQTPVVFLVWGVRARKTIAKALKPVKITENVKVLHSSHPNPRKSAKWSEHLLNSKCFLEANVFLKEHNATPVNWCSVFENNCENASKV